VDVVEQEGINRALDQIPQADLVLFVLDASRPFEAEDQLIFDALVDSRTIAVLNKSDLPRLLDLPEPFLDMVQRPICAHSGRGVDELRDVLRATFLNGTHLDSREFVAISRTRHRDVLASANMLLERFEHGLTTQVGLELLALDLRDALSAVGSVTGLVTTDDVLDVIFSSFCIGK